jgi:hypothetical protein
MKLKTYFSWVLAVSHEQLMNRLADYNECAMGWMIRGFGFESRRSRDFSFRHRVCSSFGDYPVGMKGFRHRGMTLTTSRTCFLVSTVKQDWTLQESQGLPRAAVKVLYPSDWHWWSLFLPI